MNANISKSNKSDDEEFTYHDDLDPNPPYVPKKKKIGDDDSDHEPSKNYLNIGQISYMDNI